MSYTNFNGEFDKAKGLLVKHVARLSKQGSKSEAAEHMRGVLFDIDPESTYTTLAATTALHCGDMFRSLVLDHGYNVHGARAIYGAAMFLVDCAKERAPKHKDE